ncbi:hypothetical protein DA2_3006 [Desulfovibrio sp. A2]|nr:hypothetical protein DA2_3006 [Desulfovibrio sp. A2]
MASYNSMVRSGAPCRARMGGARGPFLHVAAEEGEPGPAGAGRHR